MEEKPLFVVIKNADKTTNKIIIPKSVIDTLGRTYQLEVYSDKLVLLPFGGLEEKYNEEN